MARQSRHAQTDSADPPSHPVGLASCDRDVIDLVERSVRSKTVCLAYQPVVSARQPDRAAFFEGLVRVLDDQGRTIPARDFINQIETLEIGRVIDCLALELGLAALDADPTLKLSINMSARTIGHPGWLRTLDHGLAVAPSSAQRLILEITEDSAMTTPGLVRSFMSGLQARGISFALDDFGAGHTSFRYLRAFSFDILKIDGQFIRDIHRDPDNQVLLQALVDIGRHFEMFTVAEAVETAHEASFLAAAGIDCLQGYLYGAPGLLPSSESRRPDAPSRSATV